MSPKIKEEITQKTEDFKLDVRQLQLVICRWEEDIRLKEINALSKDCLNLFHDLQMTIVKKFKGSKRLKKQYHMEYYHVAYDFLAFLENNVDADVCVMVVNKAKSFAKLINAYSQYCNNMEEKYNIELESEKLLK